MMDIYQILKDEHRKVKDILQQMQADRENAGRNRDTQFSRLRGDLLAHMAGEEKALYPILEQKDAARDMTLEALEEHHAARLLLDELASQDQGTERWMAKLKVFHEILDHHIREEEQKLFPTAHKELSGEQEKTITARYQQEEQKVLAGAG